MNSLDTTVARSRLATGWPPQSKLEWFIEGISIAALGFGILTLMHAWPDLPVRVPRHFDLAGKPDQWGSSRNLWLLPFVGVVIYIMLTVVGRIPHSHNFPVPVTPQNAPRLYRMSRMMVAWLKAQVTCTLGYLAWAQVQVAMGRAQGVGWAFVPVTLFTIGVTIFLYWRGFYREAKVVSDSGVPR
jgi:uncharacterized membrane protein